MTFDHKHPMFESKSDHNGYGAYSAEQIDKQHGRLLGFTVTSSEPVYFNERVLRVGAWRPVGAIGCCVQAVCLRVAQSRGEVNPWSHHPSFVCGTCGAGIGDTK